MSYYTGFFPLTIYLWSQFLGTQNVFPHDATLRSTVCFIGFIEHIIAIVVDHCHILQSTLFKKCQNFTLI